MPIREASEVVRFMPTLGRGLVVLAVLAATASAEATPYLGPVAVTASKDGHRLFVAGADARQLVVVDVAARKAIRSIALPGEPTGIVMSPDGAMLYVTCAGPRSNICLIEADAGRLVGTIPAGHTAIGPAIAPDGRRLYVCNRFNNNVSVIDVAAQREVTRLPVVREPIAAAVTPDGKSVYVANHLPLACNDSLDVAACVSVIETADLSITTIRLPNGSTNVQGLCVSPDGGRAYLVHGLAHYQLPATQADHGWMNTSVISIIDARAKSLEYTLLLDEVDRGAANPWGVTTSADGRTILVSHSGTHELTTIDATALSVKLRSLSMQAEEIPNDLSFLVGLRQRIRLGGIGPRGVAVAGSRVYVAEYFTDSIGVVSLASDVSGSSGQIALGPKPQLTQDRRGEMIFHDATISSQHWQSCASCHPDGRVDALNWDLLNDGIGNPKNTRSMLLVHQGGPTMSLGVRATAESAVRAGFVHSLFTVRPEEEAVAVDSYLKSLKAVPSPYLVDGHLSPRAERGRHLFFDPKVGCARCHPEPTYTDKMLHDVGSRGEYDGPNDKFTSPRLNEVWRTAPYMHDGRYQTIRDLLLRGKHGLRDGEGEGLSEGDIDSLAEFVLSL